MEGQEKMTFRNEYPRPQFVRSQWQNLNGEWQFDFDDRDSGIADKWFAKGKELGMRIQVPFVYQSALSGIGERKPHDIVWYKRTFHAESMSEKERLILHFGAVDYEASVYVNGHLAVTHEGGNMPFSADITPYLGENPQTLAVRVRDPHEDEEIPRGKQFWKSSSEGIWYTNSTGIWQTVWTERVSQKHISRLKFTSLFDEGKVNIICESSSQETGDRLCYEISYKGESVAEGELLWKSRILEWDVDLIQRKIFNTNFHDEGRTWSPKHPNLFDVKLKLKDSEGRCTDEVSSYFGFRKVHIENNMVYLNNRPFYQKLVLDQGYWPDGLLTAPSDEALKADIVLAKEMGFNGCRKHQKMEDPRFLYWADKLGYIVWGECASAPVYTEKAVIRLADEWAEAVERDYNHPCILVWVPLNESWGVPMIHSDRMQQHFSQMMYHYLHAIDKTRLVVSNDGWEATETDICAIHNYRHGQKEETEKYECYRKTLSTRENLISMPSTQWDIYAPGFENRGEPVMLTEFGGVGFDITGENGWGYTSVENEEAFVEDYGRIMDAVFASEGLWGFCYTQLYDVEQEINGILTYDRTPKCDLAKIREINERYHRNRIAK